jgi:predicted permease
MNTLWQDLKYGLRMLKRSPGFTAVAVLSLALGIGANTAIFSLINGILLKSLPIRNPHELRVINWTSESWPSMRYHHGPRDRTGSKVCGSSFPYHAYQAFAEEAQGFSDIFAFSYRNDPVTINAGGVASSAIGRLVSGNFFKVYGAEVLIGRPITPEDDRRDVDPVTVITYDLWKRAFGLDPHVLGGTLALRNAAFTIIGVLPRHYVGPLAAEMRTDFYVPMLAQAGPLDPYGELHKPNVWWIRMMGRLAPGANEAQAQTSLQLLFDQVVSRSGAEFERPGILLQEGRHGVLRRRQGMARPLWYLQGVVGLVLLIACTNLAGLLLARGAGRQHEMVVRAAMGAGRWRLIRQSLTESMVLSLAGVGLGLLFSFWIKAALTGYIIDPSRNQHFNLQIDTNVLVFTLAVGMVTALLSGLSPAWRVGNTDPSAGLKEGESHGAPRLRWGKMLVTAQVGMSFVLVVAAGLLCRTLINVYRVDPGFDPENTLLVRIDPRKSLTPPPLKDRENFFHALRQKFAAIPGVRSVTVSRRAFLDGRQWGPDITRPGHPDVKAGGAEGRTVSDGYFATMGIDLLKGRDFRATDTHDSQFVAIVSEEFGRLFFPDEDPLGKLVTVDGDRQYQIVGLCRDHKYAYLYRVFPILYVPLSQRRRPNRTFAIRSVLPPMSLVPAVHEAVAEVDRNLPLKGITTQELILKKYRAQKRLFASLSGSLALLALALSCIGLYGIMAYNVARRTGEMGIRKALGARSWDVARPILREALTLAAVGIAIGLPAALALVQLIRGFVYGIAPHDPLTMIGAAAIMVAVAALAAWIPARRAAKIDPMQALRYE